MPSSVYTDMTVKEISGQNKETCYCGVIGQRIVFADKNEMW